MEKEKHERGGGSLYLPRNSRNYIMRVYDDKGCPRSRSSKTANRELALRRLNAFALEARKGLLPTFASEHTTIDKLVSLVLSSYDRPDEEGTLKQKRRMRNARARWELHLKPFFGGYKASRVTPTHLIEYREKRFKQKASVATTNREFALLRRAFSVGLSQRLVDANRVPNFSIKAGVMLPENNRRTGFLDAADVDRLMTECSRIGLWMRGLVECGLCLGWRSSELTGLRVYQFDRVAKTLRLEPGSTKNDDGREAVVSDTAYTFLLQLATGKTAKDWLFTRDDGSRIADFRYVWRQVCCRANLGKMLCPSCRSEAALKDGKWFCAKCDRFTRQVTLKYRGLIFHDLRRSFARNCALAGVGKDVAMQIAGWRTDALHRRYNIESVGVTRKAQEKLAASLAEQRVLAAQLAEQHAQSCSVRSFSQALVQGAQVGQA